MSVTKQVVGIDVSKHHVDVCVRPGATRSRVATRDLVAWAQEMAGKNINLAVLEATGKYERPVFDALCEAGIPTALVNPRQIRDFARADGTLAKTDRLDAETIARYGEVIEPTACVPRQARQRRLEEFVERRDQLIEARKAEKNRLDKTQAIKVLDEIEDHIERLTEKIKMYEDEISDLIQAETEKANAVSLLQTMPGVGFITAAVLITRVPELGTIGRRKIASLVGVAPFSRDSGNYRGNRTTWGGRKKARRTLFMAAFTAMRSKSSLGAFYKSLKDQGKPSKKAMVALMRKMLIKLNAMLRTGTAFEDTATATT